jgi:hypothetical protein
MPSAFQVRSMVSWSFADVEQPALRCARLGQYRLVTVHHGAERQEPVGSLDAADHPPLAGEPVAAIHRDRATRLTTVGQYRLGAA